MASALGNYGSYRAGKRTTRRAKKPEANPLYDQAKAMADRMFERAVELANILAPEVPVDTEPLDEFDQFQILIEASVIFSPGYWDDPDALNDLYRLKKQFMGIDDEELKELARLARQKKRMLPDPMMTPANPEWDREMQKMGVR